MNANLDAPQVSLCYRATTSGRSVSNHPLPSRCAIWRFLTIGLTGGIVLRTIRTLAGRASFGLRLSLAGSPQQQAESSSRRLVLASLCYGLVVRLQLLSTSPRGDAVTFGYGVPDVPRRGLSPRRCHGLTGAL